MLSAKISITEKSHLLRVRRVGLQNTSAFLFSWEWKRLRKMTEGCPVVRVPASHQCGLGSTHVICRLSLLLFLALLRRFFSGFSSFPILPPNSIKFLAGTMTLPASIRWINGDLKQKSTQRRMIFWRCTILRLAKPAFFRHNENFTLGCVSM